MDFIALLALFSTVYGFRMGFPRMISTRLSAYGWEANWEVKLINQNDFTDMVGSIVADQLSVEKDELKYETDLADLEADSVDVIAIATNIENELGKRNPGTKIRLPTEKFGNTKKYGDLITVIYDHLASEEKK